ncbi:dodecin domain-containing protein [Solimonas sp. K1W22B-7]|uniref:dodecin n=1 Tax=Solimonas sp. K1W22B-7 TaxID=2303331 RepID=UPI000E331F65|nr:dodecin [Solimonas sp. K1W22B-7]AXQ28785.1 dodecin domain-containing protein [Solimonas sp. K1W22B-7]
MSKNHVYKTTELVGSSETSVEDAVRVAVRRGAKTLHGLKWFEVSEIRGHIEKGEIGHWQVTVKLGFTLDE